MLVLLGLCQACSSESRSNGCTPRSTRCVGNGVQSCGSSGEWAAVRACTDQACVFGTCSGVCSPGSTQCADNQTEQICGVDGQWGMWPCAAGPCTSGSCSGSTMTGPSCSAGGPGMTNCGAGQESCCMSIEVPTGTYYRTYDYTLDDAGLMVGAPLAADGGPIGEADPATVTGFRLDKYLVTVGRFRQFVAAWDNGSGLEGGPGYLPPLGSGKHSYLNSGNGLTVTEGGFEPGWLASYDDRIVAPTTTSSPFLCDAVTWTPSVGNNENLPMNCVNWYEAYAFCIWEGGFLPSEAEWEYAAAGGSEQREYAWGSADPGTNNMYAIYGQITGQTTSECFYPQTEPCKGLLNIAPVGSAEAGDARWGHLDLAGDVSEWGLDYYATYAIPCTNCENETPQAAGIGRITRGGFFYGPSLDALRSSWRGWATGGDDPSGDRYSETGFRCARSP
jgi:formylglycine-generating enzyme